MTMDVKQQDLFTELAEEFRLRYELKCKSSVLWSQIAFYCSADASMTATILSVLPVLNKTLFYSSAKLFLANLPSNSDN